MRGAPRLGQGHRAPAARVRHEPGRGGPPARGPGRARARRRARAIPGARRCARSWPATTCPTASSRSTIPRAGAPDLPAPRRQDGSWAGAAALYVCRNFACQRPVTDAARRGGRPAPRAPSARRRAARRPGAAPSLGGSATAGSARPRSPARRPCAATGYTDARAGRVSPAAASASAATAWTTRRPAHHQALARRAPRPACNLVDTSTNYTEGASERLFGEALRRDRAARASGGARRSIVVSKIGYVQGENLERAQERESGGPSLPRGRQIRRGGVALHPPRVPGRPARPLARAAAARDPGRVPPPQPRVLPDGRARAQLRHARSPPRASSTRRLAAAFAFLEEQVRAGRIRAYGVSSNTGGPPGERSGGDVPHAHARGGARGRGRRPSLPRPAAAAEPLRVRGGPGARATGRTAKQTVLDARAGGGRRRARQPAPERDGGRRPRAPGVGPRPRRRARPGRAARGAGRAGSGIPRRASRPTCRRAKAGSRPPTSSAGARELRPHRAPRSRASSTGARSSRSASCRASGQALQALDRHLTGELGEQWHAWRARYVPEVQKALGELRRRAAEKSRARRRAARSRHRSPPSARAAEGDPLAQGAVGRGQHARRELRARRACAIPTTSAMRWPCSPGRPWPIRPPSFAPYGITGPRP